MVHELGHIIALGHTDYIANGEKVGSSDMRTSHIAGTPEEDDDSVMDSHSGGRYWGDWGWVGGYRRGRFTTGDMAAVQAKYGTPIWSSEITGPDTSWTISRPTFTLNHETNLVGPNVAWYVNNEVKQSGSSLSYTPASLPVGQVTIKAVVSYGGTNRTASKVITVSNPPAISGSDGPGLNTTVTYSVPTPPDGIIFAGWTVSGGSYTTTSGLANRILNIKFTAPAEYTLTANFTLPSGTPHSVQRVVVSHRPSAPVISTNVTTLPSGGIFTLTVNNYQSGITYKWYKYNRYAAQSSDSTITLDTSRPGSFSPLAEIMGGRIIVMQIYCEAVDSAGRVSDPSNTVTIAVGT